MKTNRSNKGFTLVEIMIVVVIIGLLAAMAIPAFQKVRAASQEKTIINNLRQLSAAAQQYFLENGTSTANYGDLVGPTLYIKTIAKVAGETYPPTFTQTDTLIEATGTNVAGKPIISFTN
jgi:type IV pilus assembly protein PilA